MPDWILAGKVLYDLALLMACLVAWRWGGLREWIGAAIVIGASGASAMAPTAARLLGLPPAYPYGVVDVLTLVAFDALMVRSRIGWPIWATGVQLAAVMIHIAMIIEPVRVRPYLLLQGKLAYPILLVLVIGSLRAPRAGSFDDRRAARRCAARPR